MKVRFLKDGVGRKLGQVEDVYDETLAKAWVDDGLCAYVEKEKAAPAAEPEAVPEHKDVAEPPQDKSMGRRPKRTK